MRTIKQVEISGVIYAENIPDILQDNYIYLSEKHQVAIHNCLCGCGNQVVTSLLKNEWSISDIQGKITMKPSIKNLFCGSHYILTNNIANFV